MTRFQGVRLALGLVLVGTVGPSAIAEAQRSTAGGAFLLELNGSQVGMVRGVSYCERIEWKGGTSATNVLNTRTLLRQ